MDEMQKEKIDSVFILTGAETRFVDKNILKIRSETELKTQNTELEQFLGWPSVSSVYCLLWRWTNDLVFSYLPGGGPEQGSRVVDCTPLYRVYSRGVYS